MATFESSIQAIYGQEGRVWLAELPKRVKEIASRFRLCDLKAVPDLSYNYVLYGLQEGEPIVLKLGLDSKGLQNEAFALRCFKGYGAVHVRAKEEGVLLLKRAMPGVALKTYFPHKERESIDVALKVIKRLQQARLPACHPFLQIKDWLAALDKAWDIPQDYLQKARALRDQLLQTAGPDVLLHGDLHHGNILKDNDSWVVIDPKGVVGEPAYEVAAFIRNPMPDLLSVQNAVGIIQNRIAIFSDSLNIPKAEIADWCFVQAVLAWVWALEDGCETTYWQRMVAVFEKIF